MSIAMEEASGWATIMVFSKPILAHDGGGGASGRVQHSTRRKVVCRPLLNLPPLQVALRKCLLTMDIVKRVVEHVD